MKVRTTTNGGQIFFCPGCNSTHSVNQYGNARPRWEYNNDPEKPTFSPSILVTCRWSKTDETMKDEVCHSFVKDGMIQFLNDCTHALAGQTVPVPEWPYERGKFGGIIED